MQKNTSITLGDQLSGFINSQVEAGRFASASEVVRAGLRLLQEREQHNEIIRQALVHGEQSGEPLEFDFDEFIARKKKESLKDG